MRPYTSVAFCVLASLGLLASSVVTLPVARADESAPTAKATPVQCKREWTYAGDSDEKWAELQKLMNKPAPALNVGVWIDPPVPAGKDAVTHVHDLAKLKGKIVVVQFWATWCGPCLRSVPATNALLAEYAGQGVRVLGVCNTQERRGGPMADAAAKTGMNYPTAQDKSSTSAADWGVKWWPFYFVIDRQGVVRGAGLTGEGVQAMVEALLVEQPKP